MGQLGQAQVKSLGKISPEVTEDNPAIRGRRHPTRCCPDDPAHTVDLGGLPQPFAVVSEDFESILMSDDADPERVITNGKNGELSLILMGDDLGSPIGHSDLGRPDSRL